MNSERKKQPAPERDIVEGFREFLRRQGLKSTRQRDLIAEEFGRVTGHVSVDELLHRVRDRDPGLGYATVYRTLKLLVDAGLAGARHFGEGFARFEPIGEEHHDHLLCESCGRIVEFHDEVLEARQDEVVAALGYRLTHHRHELFGICPQCLAKGVDPEEAGTLAPRPEGATKDMPEHFRRHLAAQGLRVTRQRTLIVETFVAVTDHVSVEDLLDRVREKDPTIGYATVYRTLKLLVEAGLAAPRHFGDGFTRFEPRVEEHHDHFVDVENDRVLEFHDEAIEERQDEVARKHGFRLTRHRHDLFGVPAGGGKDRG